MSLRTMIPAFEEPWVPSNDATLTTASKFSGVALGRNTAPYWFVPCQTSAPAADTVKVGPERWLNVAAGVVLPNVCHGALTTKSPTVNRTLLDVLARPASFVATACTT